MKRLLLALVLGALSVAAQAASTVTVSSSIIDIEVDDGTSIYTGVDVGDAFSATFIFGDSAAEATLITVESGAAEYTFSGSPYESRLSLANGSLSTVFDSSVVEIDDDDPIVIEEANLLNDLFGTSIMGGDPFDAWATFGGSDTEGIEFGVILWFDISIYSDLALKTFPPPLAQVDSALFFVIDRDSLGQEGLVALGSVNSISSIPVPAAFWLFGSGLGLLGWIKRAADESH